MNFDKTRKKGVQYRNVIMFMVFMVYLVSAMLRTSISYISLSLLAVKESPGMVYCGVNESWQHVYDMDSLISTSQYTGLIAAFYVGNALSIIFSHHVTHIFGSVWTIGNALAISSLMIGTIPYIVELNFYFAMFNIFISGLCNSPVFHACDALMLNWSLPKDSKNFTYVLIGNYAGIILTWPVLGLIITYHCGETAFFAIGIAGFTWSMIWAIFASDNPDGCFFTSLYEIDYIKKHSIRIEAKQSMKVPYKQIFKAKAVLCYLFFEIGGAWYEVGYIALMPLFINNVAGFSLRNETLFLALPLFIKFLSMFVYQYVYIKLMKLGYKRIFIFRIYTFISHFIASALLVVVAFNQCKPILIVFLVSICGVCGASSLIISKYYPSALSPNFCFIIYNYGVALPSCIVCLPLIFLLIQLIGMKPLNEWMMVFLFGAAIASFGGMIFIIFASDELQEWNTIEDPETLTTISGQNVIGVF